MRDLSLTVAILAALLGGWFALNRWVLDVYPEDPSEDGEYTVIRWASDPNPARVEQIALFNRLFADQKIRVVLDPSADVQKILTQAAAGSGPDVFDIYSYATFSLFVSKGVLADITDYMRQANLDLDDYWAQRRNALAVAADPQQEQFRIYCVPNNVNANVVFLNRSLYDAVARQRLADGQPMPPLPWNHWTWWDYVYLCQALTQRSADGRRYETFGSGGAGFGGGLTNFMYQAGGRLLSDAGGQILLNSPAGALAAQYTYDLVNTFHVVPSAEDQSAQTGGGGWGGQSTLGLYTAGKLGSIFIGRWGLIKVRREARFTTEIYPLPRYVPYEEWAAWMDDPTIAANPALRPGAWGELTDQARDRGKAAELGGRVTGIRRGTPHEREAFYFLEYLSSPDFNNLLTKDADAFGSRREFSVQYFSAPDPDFPAEDQHRAALLEAMRHTRPEQAAAHGAAFEITRLQNALTNNLVNAAYKPLDPDSTFSYRHLGRTPEEMIETNPTVGRAAVEEMGTRMEEAMDKIQRHQALSQRSHLPDLVGLVFVGLALVVGLRYYARRRGQEESSP
ncbi:MAG: extracellular solute-binding protein [Candidatus Latescibacteria bacterium]|nr:extracellular solute-binding protein [Candidatus Latescibacterota bacterium]